MLKRRCFLASTTATGFAMLAPGFSRARGAQNATPEAVVSSGYAPVNGLEIYYEIRGEGDPLLLIHGAFGSIEEWGNVPEILAQERQVVAMDVQGHGRTLDVDRPFSYEQLADDIAGLMNHLEIASADLVGYSMGANTALQVAIRHPNFVKRLGLISANFRTDGEYPDVVAGIGLLTPEMLAGSPMESLYANVAPQPDDFPVLVEKLKEFFTTEFAFSEEDISGIEAPAFVAIGDSDTVRPEHAVELFRLLGGGVPGDLFGLPASQLAILPATTHASILYERGDALATLLVDFLA